MVTGRKPRAPEVAEASGEYAKNPNRRNADAPVANGTPPLMPANFGPDETHKWNQLVADLSSMGVLSTELGSMMETFCRAYGGSVKARKKIEETGGMVFEDAKGILRRNPWTVEMHKFNDVMIKLLPEFGLTPSSRGRLVSMKPPKESGLAALQKRMASGSKN